MSGNIDYYFSVNSPWAYLGGQELARLSRTYRANVHVKPIALSTVFPRTGGLPLHQRAPERQAYRFIELRRWRDVRDQRLVMEPQHFPAAEAPASRIILAAAAMHYDALRLANAIHHALWAEDRNIADTPTLLEIAQRAGMDALGIIAKARAPEIQQRFDDLTEEAIQKGVFGSPWYIHEGVPYFGQDRLSFLERALEAD